MFKNIVYKTIVLVFIATTFCSCDKYLELRPQDGITGDRFWRTKEELQAAVIGIYSTINTGGAVERAFVWGELRADFIIPTNFATISDVDVISSNILPTNPIAIWQPMYRIINLCNLVIEFGPQVKSRDNTLSQEQLNGFLGEAHAIRALMYFYLARTYRDVPLVLDAVASDDNIVFPAKNTHSEIMNQVIKDLEVAESLAVTTYGITSYNKGRITKWAVNAMQADAYLWMNRYEDCIKAADKIINSGQFALVEGDDNWFAELYRDGNSSESIFEMQYDLQPGNQNPFHFMLNATNRRFGVNPLVLETFYTVDADNPDNRDIRGIDVAVNPAVGNINKYYVTTPEQSARHWIFYRLADVLLLKAEAAAMSGQGSSALSIIAEIRGRANALVGSVQNVSPDDVNGLISYILAERGREFAFEGKRWFDLLRVAKRNNFARLDVLQNAAQMSVPAISLEAAIAKLQDQNSLYLPIHVLEIQRNPNLVQNPFYK